MFTSLSNHPILSHFDKFPEVDKSADSQFPFRLKVLCNRSIPPRSPMYEYIGPETSLSFVNRVYNHSSDLPAEATVIFPETWLSVHEQRSFMADILNHPDVGSLKELRIVTQSPILMGEFQGKNVLIVGPKKDM